jgi:hypothetical protein
MRARDGLILVFVMAVYAICVFWYFTRPERYVNSETFDLLEIGMSDRDVYRILGNPNESEENAAPVTINRRETWFSNKLNIVVNFDQGGRLVKKGCWHELNAGKSKFVEFMMEVEKW